MLFVMRRFNHVVVLALLSVASMLLSVALGQKDERGHFGTYIGNFVNRFHGIEGNLTSLTA